MKKKALVLFIILCMVMVTPVYADSVIDQVTDNQQTEMPEESIEQPETPEQPVTPEQTTPQEQPQFKKVTKKMWATATCNVRSKASVKSSKLGKIAKYKAVTITGIGINSSKEYYRVKYNGKVGYVNKQFLTKTEPKFKAVNKKMYVKANCNVRSKTSIKSAKLGTLKKYSSVKVTGIGINSGKNYYRIKFNGKVGYVSKKFLSSKKVSNTTSSGSNNSSKPSGGGGLVISNGGGFGDDEVGGIVTGQDTSDLDPADEDTSGWH